MTIGFSNYVTNLPRLPLLPPPRHPPFTILQHSTETSADKLYPLKRMFTLPFWNASAGNNYPVRHAAADRFLCIWRTQQAVTKTCFQLDLPFKDSRANRCPAVSKLSAEEVITGYADLVAHRKNLPPPVTGEYYLF